MGSFKKIYNQDVTFTQYNANKQWTIFTNCFPVSSQYLTIYKGTNLTGSFSSDNDPKSEGQYERLLYAQINQLFYQKYTSLLNTSSLTNSVYYESASVQRPTSSYFIYNDNSNLIDYFPTGAMESIRIIAINQNLYSTKILPNTFILSSSAYYVTDDGYGNLYDANTHIGNLFYAHGLGIITNQDYQLMFPFFDCTPTTTTSTTTSTTTAAPTTTSTTTSTTTAEPTTTTSTTTSTTTAEPTTTTSTTTSTTTTEPTTTTSTTTSTTTVEPTTTSTTTSTTTAEPTTTTSTTTSTTTAAPTTTSTTTSTTTAEPTTTTTTSTTTSTTTAAPTTTTTTSTTTSTTTAEPTTTTSTTTSTTTAEPTTTTTSTTTSTTTAEPITTTTTSTTTSTTTAEPTTTTTTSTTTSTTTAEPTTTTSTTTSTTTAEPTTTTTTSTTTSTTTAEPTTTTSTTTSTTTAVITCNYYQIEGAPSIDVEWLECDGTTNSDTVTTAILICAQTNSVYQTGGEGNIVQLGPCTGPPTTTTSTTTSTTTAEPTTTSTTTTTTTLPIVDCNLIDNSFETSTIFNLGTTSGNVTITGSGLTTGDTYNIIYPVGGTIIHTTTAVDGGGDLSDTFFWTYDSVNTNVEITLVAL